MKTERTHDRLYLKDNYKNDPKEYFKLVKEEIEKEYSGCDEFSLCDVGCATGGFLYYIRREFPKASLTGIDIMKELLMQVNDGIENNRITTFEGDVSKRETLPDKKYNIVTMLGVLGIFDAYADILDNALNLLSENGKLLVFSLFNPEHVDVLIRAHRSDLEGDCWEPGWNCFSQLSIEKYCKERGLICEWQPFKMPFNIEKHVDDPYRSWTIDLTDGEKMIVNGIQLVHNFYLLKISKKKGSGKDEIL